MTRTSISTAGLIALIVPLAAAGTAQAGCTPGVLTVGGATCIGTGALSSNTGGYNSAVGEQALTSNGAGNFNTATGTAALAANTVGSNSTAIGAIALLSNTTGNNNTASGAGALAYNASGSNNTANGTSSLSANTTGSGNTALGYSALRANTTGVRNIAIGAYAGNNWTTGNYNIALGHSGAAGEARTIRIGVPGTQTRAFLAGVRGTNITGGQAVVVNSSGQLGVVSSSRRYKQDIRPMGDASNPLMQLRPVTFRYKQAEADGSRPLQYGLIAEEVAQTMPGLAIYNATGEPDSVAYQLLPSLLLNEYQKQGHALATTETRLVDTQRKLAGAEQRLAAMEAEMAAMKLTLERLASAQAGGTRLASAP